MPDTDARLYKGLKAPAADGRAPFGPYGFWGIAGSISPFLTLSERLFSSAPVGPVGGRTALCTASQCGDRLEFGGPFDPHRRSASPPLSVRRQCQAPITARERLFSRRGNRLRPTSAACCSVRLKRNPITGSGIAAHALKTAKGIGVEVADSISTRFKRPCRAAEPPTNSRCRISIAPTRTGHFRSISPVGGSLFMNLSALRIAPKPSRRHFYSAARTAI